MAKRILEKILGVRQLFQTHQDGTISLDTRDPAAMVREWNTLCTQLEQLRSNLSLSGLDQYSTVSKKIAMIETSCVACHISPPRTKAVSEIAREYEQKDLAHDLRHLDQNAIDALKYRLARRINNDNGVLTRAFLSRYENELNAMTETQGGDTRETVSDSIWFLVGACYEFSVPEYLGKPFNIYVAMNIRDLFAGTRYAYYKRNGVEIERENVEKWQSAFSEFIRAQFEQPEDLNQSSLAQLICTMSTQGVAGGISADMGNTLAAAFHEFAAARQNYAREVVRNSTRA